MVSLKSFSMSDIDQFVKDYEGYVAVGGPKRLAEFLGGSQLQLVRDAFGSRRRVAHVAAAQRWV